MIYSGRLFTYLKDKLKYLIFIVVFFFLPFNFIICLSKNCKYLCGGQTLVKSDIKKGKWASKWPFISMPCTEQYVVLKYYSTPIIKIEVSCRHGNWTHCRPPSGPGFFLIYAFLNCPGRHLHTFIPPLLTPNQCADFVVHILLCHDFF